ncbi:MAG: flavodoxin-dependent (E)-4-hydroxy-3-methylbut-2-enyl-diphosphate synthase [Candidatus Omnitrophica bacterium]|nr:flavodoxin-dependent (E)-4-hydroxy-3-methylbut-2-enyl-diphosphate synthase [Candidatus Omnitrophota bacterium]
MINKRRKTPTVQVGRVLLGSEHPVVIQSMTDTPTENVDATYRQTVDLIKAGSDMVRWTINDEAAAKASIKIITRLRKKYSTPIIGDFHYNGHILLEKFPECARLLDKYRINPGNVGKGKNHNDNFSQIIKMAIANKKPVRIGVNWGSIDQDVLAELVEKNDKLKQPKSFAEISYQAMIKSAIDSALIAQKIGLPKNKIILSVKMSQLQDMVKVYALLAQKCDYVLHLGLTEAGGDIEGVSSSSAALGILLYQGIGDTIRVSLTPQPNVPRAREVEVCKALLQSLGLRHFHPMVTSCPGCGRTSSDYFQHLAEDVRVHIKKNIVRWAKKYPGVEKLKIAVMGCVVNGPGESQHADIGICLPGASEHMQAPVYAQGKMIATLKGEAIKEEFLEILEDFIDQHYKAK